MKHLFIKIDVSAAIASETAQFVAGTVFLPDRPLTDPPIVMFASPGGGYSRGYFDMHFEGREGYSEAEYHTSRGLIFVSQDHLGVGESSIDQMDHLTVEAIADGAHAFVEVVVERLTKGTLDPSFKPVSSLFRVGIGQSMGAGVTMIMQGRHRTFNAIAPLGISAIHTMLPQRSVELARAVRDVFMFSRQTPLSKLVVKDTGDKVPDFIFPFHFEDEPPDVQNADLKDGYPLRNATPPFGSATVPRCAVAMMSRGYFTPEVAAISVPVLMGYGERDTSGDMRQEATAFINSSDISIFIVPRMAHMHNFANTRRLLWQRVCEWAQMVSRQSTSQ